MANIFISHSSRNSDRAIDVRNWLAANGWDDVFLDLDPERGIIAGQRWKEALQKAAHRCEVVLALVSPEWLASSWCKSEIDAARLMGKKVIVALIGVDKSLVPLDLSDEQWIDLVNDPAAYTRLKEGLKRAGLDPSSFVLESGRRPYPGFAFLEEKDAALFFGRDAQIVRGLDKMRGLVRTGVERMLVILGASGSGKSSFLRAGLWPRLKRDDRNWLPLPVIRPERAAMSGKFGLAQALLQTMTLPQFADRIRQLGLPRSRADIQEFIEKADDGLPRIFAALRDIAQVPGLAGETVPPPTIVLAIDQGEELFNEEGHDEARRLIAILTRTLKADPRVLALVAMRSDAFPQLQSEPSMAELAKDTFTLDMMLEGSYRAVIEEPARLVKPNPLKIDPQLIDALLEDISGQDALPLLAFTLAHLYEHYAADNELSLSGYEKLGRLKGVIDTTVKDAFAEGAAEGELPKDPKAQLALARAAFIPHLAQVNAAGQFVRRVAPRDEIPDEAKPLIDRFAERRLLIRDRRKIAGADAEVIEVAHETLLRQPPFSEWLAEDREFLVWRERLGQARAAFEANERGLLTGRELQFARDWVQRRAAKDIAPPDRKFINDSIAEDNKRRADEAERERVRQATELEARQARRLRLAVMAVGLLLVVAGFGWWAAFEQKNNARLTQLKFLADLSGRETEQGDAGTGLLLALEALPDGNSEDAEVRSRQYWPAAAISLERARRALLERTVLRGHDGPVNAVAPMPTGDRIVTASDDCTTRIWDLETGKELRSFRRADGKAIKALAVVAPAYIVTGDEDGKVVVWDADKPAEPIVFEGHRGSITALGILSEPFRIIAFSKDSSRDRKGQIWTVQTRSERMFDARMTDVVNAVAVTPDGKRFVTGSNDKVARVWSVDELKPLFQLTGHDGPVMAVAVARDGSRIVTGSNDNTVRIWDADTGEHRKELKGHLDAVTDVTITPDGTRIVSVSADRTARLWDADTGTQLGQIGGHQMSVDAVAVTSDGNRVVTGSKDWTTRIWDTRPRTELAQLKGHDGLVTAVAAMPDGTRIVTASSDNTARVWDARTGVEQANLGHEDNVTAVAVTPGGRVVTASSDKIARIWDTKTGKVTKLEHADAVTAVAVTRDGARIVTGSRDKITRVWDADETGAKPVEISGHDDAITAVAVMDDGRIATGSSDNTARIWSRGAASYEEKASFKGHQLPVTAVAVLNQDLVVSGSLDKTARVWEARNGREVIQLKGHQAAVTAVAVTPDGAAIVTGSRDGTVRIWDAKTFELLALIKAHERFVTAVALARTADGLRIVTGSNDKTARLWHVLPLGQALIDDAKTSAIRCLSPAQRNRYFLPPARPGWCDEKYPFEQASALIEGRRLLIDDKEDEAKALFTEALGRDSSGIVDQTWANAYIEHGRKQLAARQDDVAKAKFAEALKRDTSAQRRIDAEWADAYVARGRALLRAGKDEEAAIIFAEAMKRDPSANTRIGAEWGVAYFARGKAFLVAGKVNDAKSAFAEALKRDPSKASAIKDAWVTAYTLRGSRLVRSAKNEEADAAFAEALQQDPSQEADINSKWARAYIDRGRDLLREFKEEDAKAVFARALQHDPSASVRINAARAETFVESGLKQLEQGNDEAARGIFEGALRLDLSADERINDAWTSTYIERGVKQFEQGNDDATASLFAEAIKRDSSATKRIDAAWANGYVKRGVALISADNDGDAMTSFTKAAQHDPSARKRIEEAVVDAYIDHGKNLVLTGKDNEADAAFAKAVARNPSAKKRISEKQISTSIKRGAKLMEDGKEQEADMTFTRALKRDPAASQRINDAWGTAYNELAWKSFLELPKDKPLDNPPKAEATLRLAQKAVDLAPDNAFALDSRGAIYRAMGRIDEALADFDKAIRIGITAPSTYFERGRCHEQKGNIELAVADYQKAVELPAEDDYARSAQAQAQERLAELRGRTKSLNPKIGSASQ
jgi:WD40 repeat protein/tetratricopeptide (TPR) repeat protein